MTATSTVQVVGLGIVHVAWIKPREVAQWLVYLSDKWAVQVQAGSDLFVSER